MPFKDPEKARAAKTRYAAEHKERIKSARLTRRALRRQYIEQAKSIPCSDCNIEYPSYIMDFDHVRGVKKFNISSELHGKCTNFQMLLDEIAKCDVVCANCHRHRTWIRSTSTNLVENL